MEPVFILSLLSKAGTLTSTVTVSIKGLSDLRSQYNDADIQIRLLIGVLSTVKSALTQISDWTHYLDHTHRQANVVEGLRVSLEGCQVTLDVLAEDISSLLGRGPPESSVDLFLHTKARHTGSESSLKEHEGRLRAQVAALHLLLEAVQW